MHKNLSIIVAVAQNGAIGRDNQLLWHIPNDLKRFKSLTMGHHIIMGRKTWNSIGRPLPGRVSIVVTRNRTLEFEGAQKAYSLEQALAMAADDTEVFVIGGGELYRAALPIAARVYLTQVHAPFEGDTSFPPLNPGVWKPETMEPAEHLEVNGLKYSFTNYIRV